VNYGAFASIKVNPDLYYECTPAREKAKDAPVQPASPEEQKHEVIINKRLIHDGLKAVVFPNPARDHITISTGGRSTARLQVEIFDMQQRPVRIDHINPGQEAILNISELSKGSYVVRISDGSSSSSCRLVKM